MRLPHFGRLSSKRRRAGNGSSLVVALVSIWLKLLRRRGRCSRASLRGRFLHRNRCCFLISRFSDRRDCKLWGVHAPAALPKLFARHKFFLVITRSPRWGSLALPAHP